MYKYIGFLLLVANISYAQGILDFPEEATPVSNDTLYLVKAGGGAGTDRFVTIENLTKALLAASGTNQGVITTGSQTIAGAKTFSSAVTVPADAYNATTWNGSNTVPTKDAIRDKFESLVTSATIDALGDAAGDGTINFGTTQQVWNGSAANDNDFMLKFLYQDIPGTENSVGVIFDSTDGSNPISIRSFGTELLSFPASIPTFRKNPVVPDEAYDASDWDDSMEVPTKNSIRDKIENLTPPLLNDIGDPDGNTEFELATNKVDFLGAAPLDGAYMVKFEYNDILGVGNAIGVIFDTTGGVPAESSAEFRHEGTSVFGFPFGIPTAYVDIIVPDEAYDASDWDDSMEVPTKNSVRDKIESLSVGGSSSPGVFVKTNDTTVENTNDITSIVGTGVGDVTVPAGSAEIGTTYRIVANGYVLTEGLIGGNPTFSINIGGQTIVSKNFVSDVIGLSSPWRIECDITFRSVGETSIIYAQGILQRPFEMANEEMKTFPIDGTINPGPDTTGDLDFDVTVQWNTADMANSISCNSLIIEKIR